MNPFEIEQKDIRCLNDSRKINHLIRRVEILEMEIKLLKIKKGNKSKVLK